MKEPWELRERTKAFALRIIRLYGALPKSTEAQVIGKQVLRSGTSIGAHYREASRARTDAEFISKIGVALQELDETAYWLELLVEAEIIPSQKMGALQQETDELIAIFTTIVKKVKRKDEGGNGKDEGGRLKEEGTEWKVEGGRLKDEEAEGEVDELGPTKESEDDEDTAEKYEETQNSPENRSSNPGSNPAKPPPAREANQEIPPPPPLWEKDDETILSDFSSLNPHPSSFESSSLIPQPSSLRPAWDPVHVNLKGETYTWDGQGWMDAQFVTPPQIIIRQLNDLLEGQLAADDRQITDKYELLRRARFARENQQYERAEQLARRVLVLKPNDCGAAAVLCATLRARGRSREALSETNSFEKTASTALLTSRAAAYCDLDMWEEAKHEIGRALAMGDSDEAFAVVDRIKSKRPQFYGKKQDEIPF